MVDGIGRGGSGRAAFDAAVKNLQARSREIGSTQSLGSASGLGAEGTSTQRAESADFGAALKSGLSAVEGQVDRTNSIHVDVLEGRLDLHEVAAQLKESEITFQFALQVRNKLMDAYREVMRMSV